MDYQNIVVEPGEITWITLNRPERRNAINRQMDLDLADVIAKAEMDDAVRVIVLKGNGPCFSAGHDMYEGAERLAQGSSGMPVPGMRIRDRDRNIPILQEVWQCRKPIISAVHGFVGPWSVMLVLCTDLVIAAQGTNLSFEVGRVGGVAWLALITFLLGEKKAKEWQLMAGILTAEEAERHGLINKVVPGDRLVAQAKEWAETIASIPPQAVMANKRWINLITEHLGLWELSEMGSIFGRMTHGPESDMLRKTILEKGLRPALEMRDAKFGGRKVGKAGGQW